MFKEEQCLLEVNFWYFVAPKLQCCVGIIGYNFSKMVKILSLGSQQVKNENDL